MNKSLLVMAIASAIMISACGKSAPAPAPEAAVAPPAAAMDTAATPTVSGAKYTCPMHPEVVMDVMGKCPKCEMDLVPVKPAGDTATASGSKSDCDCAKNHPDCKCAHCSTGKGICDCAAEHHAH